MKYQCKLNGYAVFAEFENKNKNYNAFYGIGNYSTEIEAKTIAQNLLKGGALTRVLVHSPSRSVVWSSYPVDDMGHYEKGAWMWDVNILDIDSYMVKKYD